RRACAGRGGGWARSACSSGARGGACGNGGGRRGGASAAGGGGGGGGRRLSCASGARARTRTCPPQTGRTPGRRSLSDAEATGPLRLHKPHGQNFVLRAMANITGSLAVRRRNGENHAYLWVLKRAPGRS